MKREINKLLFDIQQAAEDIEQFTNNIDLENMIGIF